MTDQIENKTILIVEDDPFIAMDLEDIFMSEGYDILGPFADVEPGLEAINKTEPDIAILDFNLGAKTSIPIAKKLQIKKIPYIFISGQIEGVILDSDMPPRPIIAKPFIPETLVESVENLAL